jgi:hypothetical protein
MQQYKPTRESFKPPASRSLKSEAVYHPLNQQPGLRAGAVRQENNAHGNEDVAGNGSERILLSKPVYAPELSGSTPPVPAMITRFFAPVELSTVK